MLIWQTSASNGSGKRGEGAAEINITSAFSPSISCLWAWTSCWVMYARCAFAGPVWSDFWRSCLISRTRVYFYTYSLGTDFRTIDVVIDSEGFIIPAEAHQEFQWLCDLGSKKRVRKGRARRSEGAVSTPEETLTRLGRCDFCRFSTGEERDEEGDVSCFLLPFSQVNYTFRIY